MIIAKGTHIATAQHMPTKLINIVALYMVKVLFAFIIRELTWTTVVIKNVEKVKRLNSIRAPVQMLRNKSGIAGSCRGFPFWAASTLH